MKNIFNNLFEAVRKPLKKNYNTVIFFLTIVTFWISFSIAGYNTTALLSIDYTLCNKIITSIIFFIIWVVIWSIIWITIVWIIELLVLSVKKVINLQIIKEKKSNLIKPIFLSAIWITSLIAIKYILNNNINTHIERIIVGWVLFWLWYIVYFYCLTIKNNRDITFNQYKDRYQLNNLENKLKTVKKIKLIISEFFYLIEKEKIKQAINLLNILLLLCIGIFLFIWYYKNIEIALKLWIGIALATLLWAFIFLQYPALIKSKNGPVHLINFLFLAILIWVGLLSQSKLDKCREIDLPKIKVNCTNEICSPFTMEKKEYTNKYLDLLNSNYVINLLIQETTLRIFLALLIIYLIIFFAKKFTDTDKNIHYLWNKFIKFKLLVDSYEDNLEKLEKNIKDCLENYYLGKKNKCKNSEHILELLPQFPENNDSKKLTEAQNKIITLIEQNWKK